MNLPDVLRAGRFTAVEKYRQNLNCNWLSLHISGLKRHEVYDRHGKLVCRMNGTDTPCLALGCAGMSVDFEYGKTVRTSSPCLIFLKCRIMRISIALC